MGIKIESNIPLPERSNIKYPTRQMKVGDSFVVPLSARGPAYNSAKFYGSRKTPEWKFTARKINPGEVRIWRVK